MSTTDYVIVGGGTAGCVLAARLTEDPSCQVLLIEAGPDFTGAPISDPARWLELDAYDWGYSYAPSPHVNGRSIRIPRGRVIGGSSATNALLWYRGHPADYDEWKPWGWDYAALLPYFRRAEDWQGGASELRGSGGPMRLETSPDPHPLAVALLDAASELGLPVIDDPNGPSNHGAAYSNLMVSGGRRVSAATAYLDPARDRPNLTILAETVATELIFEGARCTGVRCGAREFRATSEVIVCLGAFGSPGLLLASGIGDAATLDGPIRADLPGVGQNLQDHPLLQGITFAANEPLGPVRDNGGGTMINWRSSASDRPDLHAFIVQGRHASDGFAARYGLDGEVFAIGPGLMRATSTGYLRLNPDRSLEIQPNFLASAADVTALAEAAEFVLELGATSAYRARPLTAPKDLRAYVREACWTFFHAAGTCAIGPVLDPDLRVRGVESLRVVDASVFPSLPSCNTTAPVIAVAERAADLIRGLQWIP